SDPTSNTSVFFADACAGATAAFAILAALNHKMDSGEGQYIDMAQAENVGHTLTQAYMDYSLNGRVQSTLGNRDAARAPQGVYRCAGDDAWLAISCDNDWDFAALCQVMGGAELAVDERFRNGLRRYENQDALDIEITAWTSAREQYDAFHALQAAGV